MTAIEVGNREWTIEDVLAVSRRESPVKLSQDSRWQQLIQKGSQFLERHWRENGEIYGVTTGYGDSCVRAVPAALVEELPVQLMRFHGCGLGEILPDDATRAMMAARLISLARGYSGVRLELLDALVGLLNNDILPVVPQEGSVGASGDLTPLSYLAAVLVGEREATVNGERLLAQEALSRFGLTPIALRPKEGLALMNGTSMMTGIACLAFDRARYLARVAASVTALAVEALEANKAHYDARLFAQKPHVGQVEVATWIREAISYDASTQALRRLQDPYSLRCAPHVIGVLVDALPWIRKTIETELNSSNDNPLIDGEEELILHGGHFYGGHIAFAMDALKTAVANVADLVDRQLALLMHQATNHGLPANLSGAAPERLPINHGFKAVQIGASAWAAEALKNTMPASVFSRSTECHNQDKVSMGSIAARDCIRVLELSEQVVAAGLLAGVQGVNIRLRSGKAKSSLSSELCSICESVEPVFSFLTEDRPLEQSLRDTVSLIRNRQFSLE